MISAACVIGTLPLAEGSSVDVQISPPFKPFGALEIWNELLYVSDNATSRISAFTLDGMPVNYLDTGLPAGSLGAMAFGPDGKLYLVDMVGSRVLRVDPLH